MRSQLIKNEIEFFKSARNELNEKIAKIKLNNYENDAIDFRHPDLLMWQNNVNDLNKNILKLRAELDEIENGK
ncbi:hypothetical protein KTG55_02710 [Acinetobacter pittii]|uniref:hypothetical protein n=1 Tax=Acinetobacter pittii TaxID=48296 RepID=UPI0021CE2716|nr:hypothetical protein [Acinetobacter pittii]MCU4328706.1 hypothetical protein [Acinetobacter pittii]